MRSCSRGLDTREPPSNDDDAAHVTTLPFEKEHRGRFRGASVGALDCGLAGDRLPSRSITDIPFRASGDGESFSPRTFGKTTLNEDLVFYTKRDCPLVREVVAGGSRIGAAPRNGSSNRFGRNRPRTSRSATESKFRFSNSGERWWAGGGYRLRALEREVSRRLAMAQGKSLLSRPWKKPGSRYFLEDGLPKGGGYGDRWVKSEVLGGGPWFSRTPRLDAARFATTTFTTFSPGMAPTGLGKPRSAPGRSRVVVAGSSRRGSWISTQWGSGWPWRLYERTGRSCAAASRSNFYGLTLDDRLARDNERPLMPARPLGLAGPTEGVEFGDSLRFARVGRLRRSSLLRCPS